MSNTTIRIRTAVAVFNNQNEILLVPHYIQDKELQDKVLWYLPGGGVEFLEKVEAAAIREYKEETGFDIELTSQADTIEYIDPIEPWHNITFLFYGKIIGGELQAETSVWGNKLPVWYSQDSLNGIEIVSYLKVWIQKSFQQIS